MEIRPVVNVLPAELKKYINNFEINYIAPKDVIIGTFIARTLSLNLSGIDIPIPDTIFIEIGLDNQVPVKQPIFIVDKTNINVNSGEISIKGFDYSIKFDKPFDLQLAYPLTNRDLVIAICNYLGVEIENTDFINANYIMTRAKVDNKNTFRDVISMIAADAGANAFINENNKLEFKNIRDSNKIIENVFKQELKNGKIGPINSIVLAREPIQDYIVLKDNESITQYGKTEIKITNNSIVDDNREGAIQGIYNILHNIEFYCEKIKSYNGYEMKPFDLATVEGKKVLISNIKIRYPNMLDGEIGSEQLSKTETNYKIAKAIEKRVINAEAKVDKVAGQIDLVVDSLYNFAKTILGTNKLILDDAVPTNILKFIAKVRTTNFLLPSDTLLPSETLLPRDEDIVFVIDNLDEQKEYIFDIQKPVYYVGDVSDELIIEFNEETALCTFKIIRNISNVNGTLTILDNPIEEVLYEDRLILYKGTNYLYIKDCTDWELEATYMANNELNKYFASKVETLSQISIAEENINLRVETKADKDHLISQMNLSPEEIKLMAKLISIEGLVTANENFKVLLDGSIEAKNGSFSGNIYLQEGGKVLGGDGILTNLQYNSTGKYANFDLLGYNVATGVGGGLIYPYLDTSVDVEIPDNFTIVSAFLLLNHTAVQWTDNNNVTYWGGSKNLKLFKAMSNYTFNLAYGSEYVLDLDNAYLTEIPNAFENSSYTPSNQSSNSIETKKTIDIKDYITTSGNHKFIVRTTAPVPTSQNDAGLKTGMAKASVIIYGYTKL